MTAYGQFCPVAKTAEMFAERWTPLIIRELCGGPTRFNRLRQRLPLISKTLLVQRLRELEQRGIVATGPDADGDNAYALTPAGEDFRPLIEMMSLWGQRHTQHILRPEDFDPHFLLQSVMSQIPRPAYPADRFVIRFEFSNLPRGQAGARRWWFVFQHPVLDLCHKDPGHPEDVVIAADLETFTRIWMGYLGLTHDSARRAVAFAGPPDAVERSKSLLGLFDRPRERRFIFAPPEIVDRQGV